MRFGEFEVTAAGGELRRNGAPVHLQPQPMKVLTLLVSRAGELVTRDELRKHVWGDETFVDFDQNLNWCIRRIREVLGDDANAPRFIQTVPRRGYRFIAAPRRAEPRRSTGAIAAALALALLAGSLHLQQRPTVLVLPFDDLGGANRVDAVATSEVIHSLAKLDDVGVIDPLTAAKFKKSGECIIKLGQQLGAQYVMLGAVRGTGARLRLTAQLFRVADNQQAGAWEQELAAGADVAAVCARIAGEISSKTQRSLID